jgi:polyisoprenoid-binding protein YceI
MTAAKTKIPGYVVGTWTIDPVHSGVAFIVQHLMVSKIRGEFTEFTGNIVTAENVLDSHAEGEVKMATIDTGNQMRDDDLRGSNFFDIATYPKMTFTSTGLRPDGGTFLLDGDITIRGVTRPVTFTLELGGFGADPYGGTRAGFSASTEINRTDFGVSGNAVLESGGVMVGEQVKISLEIEAILSK